jgi:hypothetical protein
MSAMPPISIFVLGGDLDHLRGIDAEGDRHADPTACSRAGKQTVAKVRLLDTAEIRSRFYDGTTTRPSAAKAVHGLMKPRPQG